MAASEPCARPKPAFVYMVRCTGGQLYTQLTDPAAQALYVALFQTGWFLSLIHISEPTRP